MSYDDLVKECKALYVDGITKDKEIERLKDEAKYYHDMSHDLGKEIKRLKKENEWLLNAFARQTLEIDMGNVYYEGKKQHIKNEKIEIEEEMQQALKGDE